jgi:hypothetical protein
MYANKPGRRGALAITSASGTDGNGFEVKALTINGVAMNAVLFIRTSAERR